LNLSARSAARGWMSWGTKWAREKVERATRAVVDAEQRLAKVQEAIAKANAGVLRAERDLGSAKRKLKLAGQRAAALEAKRPLCRCGRGRWPSA
jgi:hypothetical protein